MVHYSVGDTVFARVNSFQPYPAIVENVLLNETDCSVFYYVRLLGASEIVPLDEECLLPIKEYRHAFKLTYTQKEMVQEAKKRVDSLIGADDEIPEVLMNFVTVDSDFEEVSVEAVKKLGLHSIVLPPETIQEISKISPNRKKSSHKIVSDDEYIDVEDDPPDNQSSILQKASMAFSCSTCPRSFNSRRALKTHKTRSVLCKTIDIREVKRAESKKTSLKNRKEELKNNGNNHDLNKKVEELIKMDKSKWSSRSASGYFPCKLCFRKFRFKSDVQSHMESHLSHMGLRKEMRGLFTKRKVSYDSSEGEDSISVGDNTDDKKQHNLLERERRAELAAKFEELASAIGMPVGSPKVQTLAVAKRKIEELEKESQDQEDVMAQTQDTNMRLRARLLELKSRK